jgi:hypothetical protein
VAELIQPFWARAAIERRDSLAAAAAMRTHLTNSRARLAVSFGPDQGRAVASRGTPCEVGVRGAALHIAWFADPSLPLEAGPVGVRLIAGVPRSAWSFRVRTVPGTSQGAW